MAEETSVLSVALGSIAFAVATILALIILALVFARHLQWKMRDLSMIQRQIARVQEQRQGVASRWLLVQSFLSFLVIVLVVFLAIKARWNLIALLLLPMVPISLILREIAAVKSQVGVSNLPFRPVHLLTGDDAVRRGKIYLVVGSASFIVCSILAIIAASM
jgi:hypothetical protein